MTFVEAFGGGFAGVVVAAVALAAVAATAKRRMLAKMRKRAKK